MTFTLLLLLPVCYSLCPRVGAFQPRWRLGGSRVAASMHAQARGALQEVADCPGFAAWPADLLAIVIEGAPLPAAFNAAARWMQQQETPARQRHHGRGCWA
jgi:hypothetical protein